MLTPRQRRGGYLNWCRDTPSITTPPETIVIHNNPTHDSYYLHIGVPVAATELKIAVKQQIAVKRDSETAFKVYLCNEDTKWAKWALLISNYHMVRV